MFTFLLLYAAVAFINLVFTAEKDSFCVTPNEENATCIPISSCYVIERAITYLEEDAIEFAQKSQCGYVEEPLVCCGSVGRKTTLIPKIETTTIKFITSEDVLPPTPLNNPLLPSDIECGFHITKSGEQRITGIAEHRWLALLNYKTDNYTQLETKCMGTLINKKYILTLAECFFILNYTLTSAVLGEWSITKDVECLHDKQGNNCKSAVIEVPVEKFVAHPYYNNNSRNNNIGLVKLTRYVLYSDYIYPICLPPINFPPPAPGILMETAGWKLTADGTKFDTKLKLQISSVDREVCEDQFPNFNKLYPNQVCAQPVEEETICNKERGNPLLISYEKENKRQKRWFMEGILSEDFGCKPEGKPNLYIRVSRYVGWILNNIN